MRILTIGFTKTSAERFFGRLKRAGVKRIIDVRLNNVSQLAGFAKRQDLSFFLREICDIEYLHLPDLAPTKSMLDAYKKHGGDWSIYEREFLDLMKRRSIEKFISPDVIGDGCLLCSEDKPHHCHRRLVAEYLKGRWGDVDIHHL
ncbi:DUF488 domain-containing protein [Frateuria edaphi]|uniref:DUF488 domain-containing protein n=1 Tax=Frateuria edaphi TaxID=2898793 RepID=UPI001E2EE73A|nr:DUF488 domain-containing protein [Frateuria edaphi]UGB44648.1 DUF488 domain-containing protein [Frateuria edaphi]